MAPRFLNALHLASDFISTLRNEQRWLAREGAQDSAYDIPYSTVHAGRLEGGVALNVVPDRAVIDFEIRHLAADDPETILQRIGAAAAELEAIARAEHASAAIHLNVVTSYPGLGTPPHSPAVRFASALLPDARQIRVAYGTEAGFFDKLGIPTVVCGPGSMDQGHQPDEFIARDQLALCDRFLRAVVDTLAA
jgi:acetylornithine deacetylase